MMLLKKIVALISSLFLMSFLFLCSGCGPEVVTPPPVGAKPDSVRIEVFHYLSTNPAVFITDAKVVQQIYTKLYALPAEPTSQACPAIAGPSYTLTFDQGGKQLRLASLQQSGCGGVYIQGVSQEKQFTMDFWSFLMKSAKQAAATTEPTQLAIQPLLAFKQPAQQTMQISSVATAQRLYTAILALPQRSSSFGCQNGLEPAYQLAFQGENQLISVQIDATDCDTVIVDTLLSSTAYLVNEQFKQILKQTMAQARFAPAQPDALSIRILNNNYPITVHDTALIQSFYKKFLTLQVSMQGNCPSEGGKYYTFFFSQANLPLQVFTTNETQGCKQITNSFNSDVNVQGDAEFWNFVHSTVEPK